MGWGELDDTTPRAGILPADDPLAASQGCLVGLILVAPFWGAFLTLIWFVATHR